MRLLMNPPSHLSLFLVFSSEIEEKWLGKEARGDLYIRLELEGGGSLTSLMAVEDLGKLLPPVRPWYLFSRAESRSFSWNMKTGC